jgi:hypothetical protein
MPGEFTTFGGDSGASPVPLDELAGQITSANEMVTAIISDGLAKLATYISQASQQLSKTTKAVRAGVKRQITKAAAPVVSAVGSLSMQAQNRISEGQIAVDRATAAARTISTENRTGNATYIPPETSGDSGIYTPPPGGSTPVVGMSGVYVDAQGLTYTQTPGGASYWGAGTPNTVQQSVTTTDSIPATQSGVTQVTPAQQNEIQQWATGLQAQCNGVLQVSTDSNAAGLDPAYYWTLVGSLPQYGVYAYCGTKVPTSGTVSAPISVPISSGPPVSSGPQTIDPSTGTITSGCGTPPFFLMGPNSTGPYYAQPSSPTIPSGMLQSLLPGQVSGATAVWDSQGLLCGYLPGDGALSGIGGGSDEAPQTQTAAPCELPPDIASWPGQRIVQLPYDLNKGGQAAETSECGKLMANDAVSVLYPVSHLIDVVNSGDWISAFFPQIAVVLPSDEEDMLYG